MIKQIDLEQLQTVCRMLDLDPDNTHTIVLTPQAAFVTTLRTNAEGCHFLDAQTGLIACDYAVIPVNYGPAEATEED